MSNITLNYATVKGQPFVCLQVVAILVIGLSFLSTIRIHSLIALVHSQPHLKDYRIIERRNRSCATKFIKEAHFDLERLWSHQIGPPINIQYPSPSFLLHQV